jgi:hypothetical protein
MPRLVSLPLARVDVETLRAELIAAGVPLRPMVADLPPSDVYTSGDRLIVVIDADARDDQYDASVAKVLAAHQPTPELTPEQAKRQQAKVVLASTDDLQSVVSRAMDKVRHQEMVEIRNAINDLIAGRRPQPLVIQTLEQVRALVEQQIDADVTTAQSLNRIGG